MTKKLVITQLAALTFAIGAMSANAATIELRADAWCPFNCEPGSEQPGFMVEIAQEALALYGHKVNYETMNWARSLEYARNGRIDGVIGTDDGESPDFIFGTPIGTYREAAAFRPGEGSSLDDAEGLIGLRVGGITGYEYSDFVAEYVEENADTGLVQLLSGDTALEQNLRKLLAGRVDLVPDERSVLAYTLASMNIATEVEIVLAEQVEDLFIGFSPARESSTLYARQLSEGIAQLQASGRIAEIMSRYGLAN